MSSMHSATELDSDPRLARKRVPRAVSNARKRLRINRLTCYSVTTVADESHDVMVKPTAPLADPLGMSDFTKGAVWDEFCIDLVSPSLSCSYGHSTVKQARGPTYVAQLERYVVYRFLICIVA